MRGIIRGWAEVRQILNQICILSGSIHRAAFIPGDITGPSLAQLTVVYHPLPVCWSPGSHQCWHPAHPASLCPSILMVVSASALFFKFTSSEWSKGWGVAGSVPCQSNFAWTQAGLVKNTVIKLRKDFLCTTGQNCPSSGTNIFRSFLTSLQELRMLWSAIIRENQLLRRLSWTPNCSDYCHLTPQSFLQMATSMFSIKPSDRLQ